MLTQINKMIVILTVVMWLVSGCSLLESGEPTLTPVPEVEEMADDPTPTTVLEVEEETAATSEPAEEATATSEPSDGAASSAELGADSSTGARILARGKLLAAYYPDVAPFTYEKDGQAVGFDVDIVREFARRWLGDEEAVEFVPVSLEGRLTSLANGEVDLTASAMTHKRERDEVIDFSQIYYADAQRLLVQRGSGINELEDLDGKRVGGIQDTTGLAQIAPLAERARVAIELIDYPNHAQAVDALLKGQIDAVTSDGLILAGYVEEHPELGVVGRRLSQEPYGIGVPQGEADFREFVNFTLQDMKQDGTYDEIYERWFPNDEPYPIVILPGEAPYGSLADLPAKMTAETPSRIEDILKRNKIIAGYDRDVPPFSYDEEGVAAGFDIEIVKEFARRWLGDREAVEFVPVSTEERLTSVANGEVDLTASAITHKRERDKTVDFSQNYYADAQKLLVRQESGINDLRDLDSKRVGAIQNTTGLAQIAPMATAAGITIDIIDYPNHAQAVEALLDGLVEAVTSDGVILASYAQEHENLAVVGQALSQEPYGIGVPMDDYRLRELVNFTLQEMKRDGSYDRIYQDFFAGDAPYEIQILSGDADYLLLDYVAEGLNIVPDISVIERIRERGNVLRAGIFYEFEPFGYLDESGQPAGFEVDLVLAIAEEWGARVEFVEVKTSNRIRMLETREVDLIAATLIHSKGDEEKIDYSQTYFVDGQSLLVRADEGAIGSIKELDGARVATVQGSPFKNQLEAYAEVKKVQVLVQEFETYNAALAALKGGKVNAVTANRALLAGSAQEEPSLVLVPEFFRLAPYGLGLPSGDSFFNNLVNFTIQTLKEEENGSSRYDAIYEKWFGGSVPFIVEVLPGKWPYTIADSPTSLDKPVQSKVNQLSSDCFFVAGVKYDAAPFGFILEGEIVGFDVDIVKEFAQRWCGDENAVELTQVTSANRIPKLAAGEIDMIAASMTHKQERDETIDFSQTYFLDGQSLLVREESGIGSVADLDGKIVAGIQGSTSIDNIRAQAEKEGVQIEILEFLEYPPAVAAVKGGQVDALTTDSGLLKYFAQQNGPGLAVVGERFSSEPYGLGLPNYDDRFRDLVNVTLQEMKEDGSYDRIYAKWFGSEAPYPIEIWPGSPYLDANITPMVRISAGDFIRGSNEGLEDEAPEQVIYLDEFVIDQYEVTTRHYEQCVKAGRCRIPRLTSSGDVTEYYANWEYDRYPVIWVSWHDATAYCDFVGKRLPTEAEWEKAARGADGSTYPWGEATPTSELAKFDNLTSNTAPIGSYPLGVSPYGVHDMAGNVREWVNDWYERDAYQNSATENPSGAPTGSVKVIRGGAWNDGMQNLATTRRREFLPDDFEANLGFRCASTNFPPKR